MSQKKIRKPKRSTKRKSATPGIRGFFHRRIMEITGLGLIAFSLFLTVAMLTHDPADPSFNRAVDGPVSNAGGYTGAFITDLLYQLLGMASVALIIVPAIWGGNLITKRRLNQPWLRMTLLVACLPFTAAVFSLINAPVSWPVPVGLGGYIGWVLSANLSPLITEMGFAFTTIFASIVTFALALGLSWQQWDQLSQRLVTFLQHAGQFLMQLASHGGQRAAELFYTLQERRTKATVAAEPRAPKVPGQIFRSKQKPQEAGPAAAQKPKKRSAPAVVAPRQKKPATQSSLDLAHSEGEYLFPSVSALATPQASTRKNEISETALSQNARLLESVLEDFGVYGEITNVRPGPVVTLYELEPAPGTKSARVIGLADDIARSMSAVSARIAVIPGRNAIGIELPNRKRETVFLREMLESESYQSPTLQLPLALGKDIGGDSISVDLAKMPHLLVAGTTGSGKSVAINTMIMSLLYRLSPSQCKFIMIDPKMLELSIYDGIPQLLTPVVTEPGKAVVALKWAVKEMENRYRLMSNMGVRNISGYNKRIREAAARGEDLTRHVQTGFDPETGKPIMEDISLDMTPLPYLVIIVDEMADLMLVAGKEIESSIQRLAQMARAAGIHLIMATQRPSVDVITGVIKANFPTRISFQVTSKIDSRTILGEMGAEQLLGQGDMLYMAGGSKITRVHGPFVSDEEVESVVKHLKEQGEPEYVEAVTEDDGSSPLGMPSSGGGDSDTELYDQAVAIVCNDGRASTSYIQRKLRIGYNRAASLIDRMEEEGIISQPNHVGKREILARQTSEV